MTSPARPAARSPDVVVVGAGLVGLACAAAAADHGFSVHLVGAPRPGEASEAAAGMLAPSVEHGAEVSSSAHAAGQAARDRYPEYVAALAERTGITVPLNRLGILEVALDEQESERLRASAPGSATWLDPRVLAAEEPALSHAAGALFHPADGAVDNVVLVRALRALVATHPAIVVTATLALGVELGADDVTVLLERGERVRAGDCILAAGAWAPRLAGLPRPLPVEPVRGQMISFAARPLRHVVYGAGGYVVPRDDRRTLVGATVERVGFVSETTRDGVRELERVGAAICPPLHGLPRLAEWSGLRPVTPDLQPILGRDPERPRLIYACGHSRNGVLLAPLTGDAIAAVLSGSPLPQTLREFGVARFEAVSGPGPELRLTGNEGT